MVTRKPTRRLSRGYRRGYVPPPDTTPPDTLPPTVDPPTPTQPTWPSLAFPTITGGVRYVKPNSFGSGLSWSDPADIGTLNTLIQAVGPGGVVYIKADNGTNYYQVLTQITLSAGGAQGAPVHIIGINEDGSEPASNEFYARIVGTRDDWTLPADSSTTTDVSAFANAGNTIFRLNSGSQYLLFRNLWIEDAASMIQIGANNGSTGLQVERCYLYNVQRGIWCNSSSVGVNNCLLRQITAIGFSKKLISFRNDSANNVVEYCNLNSGRQDKDNFAAGVCFDETCNNNTVRYVVVRNCHDSFNSYWNGDGFSDETNCYNNTFLQCEAYGCTDGGFDCKGRYNVFDQCIGEDNKRNWRIWGIYQELRDCISKLPNLRGGTGDAQHIAVFGDTTENPRPTSADAICYRLRMYNATASAIGVYVADYDGVCRFIDAKIYVNNVFTANLTDANVATYITVEYSNTAATNTSRLSFVTSGVDTTAPTITSSASKSVTEFAPVALTLTANETVTWDIPDGTNDANLFRIDQPARGTAVLEWYRADPSTAEVGKGYATPEDVDGNNVYVVTVRARDLSANETRQTISITVTAGASVSTRYIRATAAGNGSGSSWANAGTLANLNAFIGSVGPGGTINIAAEDTFTFTTPTTYTLTKGGTVGNPVTIRALKASDSSLPTLPTGFYAQDLNTGHGSFSMAADANDTSGVNAVYNAMAASFKAVTTNFIGPRNSWTLPTGYETTTTIDSTWTGSSDTFVLFDFQAGATYLTFQGFYFEAIGEVFRNNVQQTSGVMDGLTVQDCCWYNVRRFVDSDDDATTQGGTAGAWTNDVTIQRVLGIGHSKSSIKAGGNSSGWVVKDFNIHGGRMTGDNFSCGPQFTNSTSNITIQDGVSRCHHQDNGTTDFWQGDGVIFNSSTSNVTIDNVHSFSNAEGGFDVKFSTGTFTDCIARDNGRNYRIWRKGVTLTDCQSQFPNKRSTYSGNTREHVYAEGSSTDPVFLPMGYSKYVRFKFLDVYNWEGNTEFAISAITRASPGVVTHAADDWTSQTRRVFIKNVGGMTQLAGFYGGTRTNSTVYNLKDKYGQNWSTSAYSAYTSGGTIYQTSGGIFQNYSGLSFRFVDCSVQPAMPGAAAPPAPQPPPVPQELQQILDLPIKEEVEAILKDDVLRAYRIDVESDSTIRADLTRNQQAMAEFVQGTAAFIQAMAPAVQGGVMPPTMAITIFSAFCRNFRLGRQVDTELEKLADDAAKKAEQPPPPPPPDPAMEKVKGELELGKQRLQLDQAKAQQDGEIKMKAAQQEAQIKMMLANIDAAAKEQKAKQDMAMREREHAMQMHAMRQGNAMEAQRFNMDARGAVIEQNMNLQRHGQEMAAQKASMQQSDQAHKAKLAAQKKQAAQKSNGARK